MTPGEGEIVPGPPGGGELPDAVLTRMEAMSNTLAKVAARIETVAVRERRTRRLTWGLVISIVLDISLTVIVSVLSVNAISQGSTLHKSQLAACAIGNQARVEQLQLWGYVFALSAKSGGSNPAQLRQLQAFISKTFTPVDCVQVYKR